MSKKYIAEFVGTFVLGFVVVAAVSATGPLPFVIPVMAGLVLGLFVYTIGSISGCHINPAVTIGLVSIKKISINEAVQYITAQLLAVGTVIVVTKFFGLTLPTSDVVSFCSVVFLSEALGASVFAFGIASVVYGRVADVASGLVIGGSLMLGIIISVLGGAAGILNPAVAIALGAVSLTYLAAPVLGAVVGFKLYTYLVK